MRRRNSLTPSVFRPAPSRQPTAALPPLSSSPPPNDPPASPTPRRTAPLSLTILGSGGSAAVPDIACVTSPSTGCACCLDTVKNRRSPNVRGNTGAVLRVPPREGKEDEGEKTILIDCGKTFREQALKIFPKKGFRRIDTCILTHHHADAVDGLDDLRAWTYASAIERTIPIYCTRTTFDFIRAGFPYLVSKAAASGSGAVPSFEWHVMPDDQPWDVCGVRILPVPAHHGHFFTRGHPPLICLGFVIEESVLYMSDVSYIPEETWTYLSLHLSLPSASGLFPSPSPPAQPLPRLLALLIDCTHPTSPGPSHFALPQAVATARRLGVRGRTYLTDLGHHYSHQGWVRVGEALGRGEVSRAAQARARESGGGGAGGGGLRAVPAWRVRREEDSALGTVTMDGWDPRVEDHALLVDRALEAVEEWAGGVLPGRWVRPARDGMTIEWTREEGEWDGGRVWDDEYE
ncbi:hypothetical protein JCM10207_000013 [Rhodosporidiobolus poonsookiae]